MNFVVSEYLYSTSDFALLRVSFKALCHFAKDLAEQVGYGCDEVEEGEAKEEAESSTKLADQ